MPFLSLTLLVLISCINFEVNGVPQPEDVYSSSMRIEEEKNVFIMDSCIGNNTTINYTMEYDSEKNGILKFFLIPGSKLKNWTQAGLTCSEISELAEVNNHQVTTLSPDSYTSGCFRNGSLIKCNSYRKFVVSKVQLWYLGFTSDKCNTTKGLDVDFSFTLNTKTRDCDDSERFMTSSSSAPATNQFLAAAGSERTFSPLNITLVFLSLAALLMS